MRETWLRRGWGQVFAQSRREKWGKGGKNRWGEMNGWMSYGWTRWILIINCVRCKSAGGENMDNKVDWGDVRKDQTSLQRTTLIYEYTIILLEPPHRSPLSLSPPFVSALIADHYRLLYLPDISLLPSLSPEFFYQSVSISWTVYCRVVYYGCHYLCYSNCLFTDNSNQLHLCSFCH